MKRLSLKTRLVLLHTGMMALVVCIVLALLFSISSREIASNVENTLEARPFSGPLKIWSMKTGVGISIPI